jgi:type IV pilus assembly protein PilV
MLMIHAAQKPPAGQCGSVLLESLIAILIFSFGILGLVGLQAASIKNTTQAKERIDASLVANQRIAEMWVDRANLAGYTETDTDIANTTKLPNGKRTTVIAGDQVTITVNWQMPGDSAVNQFETIARINGN